MKKKGRTAKVRVISIPPWPRPAGKPRWLVDVAPVKLDGAIGRSISDGQTIQCQVWYGGKWVPGSSLWEIDWARGLTDQEMAAHGIPIQKEGDPA